MILAIIGAIRVGPAVKRMLEIYPIASSVGTPIIRSESLHHPVVPRGPFMEELQFFKSCTVLDGPSARYEHKKRAAEKQARAMNCKYLTISYCLLLYKARRGALFQRTTYVACLVVL